MSDLLETAVERVYLKNGESFLLDQAVIANFINETVLSGYLVDEEGMRTGAQKVVEMRQVERRVPLGLNPKTGEAVEAPGHWYWQDRRHQTG